MMFTTIGGTGTFTDSRDNHQYNWVIIGTQTWMAENLAYLPSVSPSLTGSKTDMHYYVNEYEGSSVSEAQATSNYTVYGVLYNWTAAVAGCPTGWHLPSDAEWKTLEIHLGMSQSDADAEGERYSGDVGDKLKSASGWLSGGNGSNTVGFTALPGGRRYNGGNFNYQFGGVGRSAFFRTSTSFDIDRSWNRMLADDVYSTDVPTRWLLGKEEGFSIRCVKD